MNVKLKGRHNYWGHQFLYITTSYEQHELVANNTQELYNDYDATLSEPCSGVPATPVFLVIAVFALITSSVLIHNT